MKISLDWLNDYIETGLPAEKIADTLSSLGFPCEGIEYADGDAVINVEITSNRGDCLGYIGIARELAAATGKKLKMPDVELANSGKAVTEFAEVEIKQPELCHRYTARIIEGIKIGPSPEWVAKRLRTAGLRSVNNVVDATNYAMLETGQPPHAFDYKKISGGKIIVRKAKAGEQLISIDGSKCDLDENMLVIADSEKPVAIAGIMGGLDTEVSDSTKTILLEDAYFDPVNVRTTSRKLALASESSFRFERIVDVEMIDFASRRACQLITQLAGGKVADGLIDIYPEKPSKAEITLRLNRLNKLLGIAVPEAEVMNILQRLGFAPKRQDDKVVCICPSWRSDIYREADLIEEVARVYGYGKVPVERKIQIEVVAAEPRQQFAKYIGTYLNGCGFYETVNVTFVDDSAAALFGAGQKKKHLAVKDESRKNANLLRQSLLGSLFGVLKTNLNAKNTPCRIFEIATTFQPTESSQVLPVEKTRLGLVSDGNFRGLRGVIEGLLKNINKEAEISFRPAKLNWAEVGAEVLLNNEVIGTAGIISKEVAGKFDFKAVSSAGAELDFDALMVNYRRTVKIKPIRRFPAIERDLSIIVDEQTAWDDIAAAINKKAPAELEDIKFVGIYHGKGIPAGQKSVTLSLRFRDEDGTLTHETVDKIESAIIRGLNKSVAAKLRTV